MTNPYKILGVEKSASTKAIKASYRTLAKKHHPDLNLGSKDTQEFKDISAAYELLSDPKKRASYDSGEIDEKGQPVYSNKSYKDYADQSGGARYHQQVNLDQEDLDELLKNMFGGQARGPFGGFQQTSPDAHYSIDIDFMDAVQGAKKIVQIPGDKKLEINIPKGIEEGQKLRLKGKGVASAKGVPPGDAYVEIRIRPHAFFRRKGHDIYVDVPISIDESVLGKDIQVPTIHGPVIVHLSKGVNSGTVMRLKGKGILNGAQLITLKVVMPEKIDAELEAAIQKWADKHSYNPRKDLERV